MSVFDKGLDGRSNYDLSLETIRHYSAGKRVLVAFSGGKDSQCVYHLCKDAGISFDAQYSITRFEPPELIKFIRENYKDVTFRRAYKTSLVNEIVKSGFPTRWSRWCCDAKHRKTDGYDIAFIGVRGEESPRRRDTWRTFGRKPDGTYYCCPIFYWSEKDVWEYLSFKRVGHCSLYDHGYNRIGCVLCPLAGQKSRDRDAKRYPKFVNMFRIAARKFVQRMEKVGFVTKTGTHCADWCEAEDPAEELLQRWIKTGQTTRPIGFSKENGSLQCVFEGSGFSEKDGGVSA